MDYKAAQELAHTIYFDHMDRYCVAGRVAGSIRRGKSDVKDIELVVVPKWEDREVIDGLFDTKTVPANLLYENFHNCAHELAPKIQWIKTGTQEIIPWQHKPDGKYWRGYLPEHDMKLDLFLCTKENWGPTFLIRTGSWEFSRAIVTHAKRVGFSFDGGYLWRGDERLSVSKEADVFELLGLEFIPPQCRENEKQIKPLKR